MSAPIRITDANGITRLVGTDADGGSAPAGTVLPVAIPTGATVDAETYESPIGDGGPLTTLVFPADCAALAIAIDGDAFPRVVMGSDPTDVLFYLGDGTYDPSSGANISVSGGQLNLQGKNPAGVGIGGPVAVSGTLDAAHLGSGINYLTAQSAPPTTYQTPCVFDDSPTTGGLYVWNGSNYVQVTTNP